MGHRGNYIIKSQNKIDIYYTHWRANFMATDLFLGESKFVEFVKQFDKEEQTIPEPFIEGCILIDYDKKELVIWEVLHLNHSSVREKYLRYVQSEWEDWKIEFAEKGLYDIEKKVDRDFTSYQHIFFSEIDSEKLKQDKKTEENKDIESIVIMKRNDTFDQKGVYSITSEELFLIGEQIIEVLDTKDTVVLPKEIESRRIGVSIIDFDTKTIVMNTAMAGAIKNLKPFWKDWKLDIGNFGYIKMLEKVGMKVDYLKMEEEDIKEAMHEILNKEDSFDPMKIAKIVMDEQEGKDLKFGSGFFENIKPKKS